MPRSPYEPASWHSLSWLTFWLSICNTGLPLPRGSKIKGLLSIRYEYLTGSVLTCPASVVTFSRDIVICRSIIHLFCSGQCHIGVASHGNNSSLVTIIWTLLAGRGLRSGVAVRGFVSGMGPAAVAVGRIAPNGAYRSEGPCRHNMSYIFVISKVVFEPTKI